eukprot:jgi/Botrbrau1/17111/Bobra.0157s0013.1
MINLALSSIGTPLPYWAHLAAQLLSATLVALHNGWLCVERLDSPHFADTVTLHQAWLRSLTFGTRAILGTTGGNLEAYEETALGSCEACLAAVQWVTALLFMEYQVYEEYCMRRRFLLSQSNRFEAGSQRNAVLAWPFGSRSGVYSLVIAFGLPPVVFAATWQGWLIMLHWLVQEWHVDGHTPNFVLRLPYAFSCAGSHACNVAS